MAPSARSRPWAFTFHPNGRDPSEPVTYGGGGSSSSTSSPWPKQRVIPINSFAPIDMENDHFKGKIAIIHDTGNEVGLEADEGDEEDTKRKGVQLQMQGKFKRASSLGADTASGLYVGGELMAPLKLGFFMSKVVGVATSYVKKKTEGRFHFVMGDSKQNAQLSFPIAQLFTIIETPQGQDPPRLQSQELQEVKWQGAARLDVNTTSTYTMCYKTPYLDCCSWELLNVPGVSPMPLERILGEITASDVVIYDLGIAGSHANWRKGAVINWYFTRRQPGECWLEGDHIEGENTPLDEGSDASEDPSAEASEEEHPEDDEDDELLGVDGDDDASDDSDSSSDGPVDDDEEEQISRAESQALEDLASWRMSARNPNMDEMRIHVPYYIETIDRRRRRKLRVWYVFELVNRDNPQRNEAIWTAKNLYELKSLCRPRPRLRAFRRRRGATRGCQCYGVQTLEQFRQVVRKNLENDSKLRRVVVASASPTVESRTASKEAADSSKPEDVLSKDLTDLSSGGKVSEPATEPLVESKELAKSDESHRQDKDFARRETPGSTETPRISQNAGGKQTVTSEQVEKLKLGEKIKNLPQEMKQRAEGVKDNMKQRAEGVKDKAADAKEKIKEKAGDAKEKIKEKAGDAKKKIRDKVQSVRRRGPALPPPFFVSAGSSACDLAFNNAKEGRTTVVHEGLVGSIHYEGRLVEELLRISKDGIIRLFLPYDCEVPRLRLDSKDILKLESIQGLFLGRFYLWEVHTLLRVFVFCSSTEEDRKEWLRAFAPDQPPKRVADPCPISRDSAALLMDLSRARRWRPNRRIVLNDRRVLYAEDTEKTWSQPQTAERILDNVLSFNENPSVQALTEFIDGTCRLKEMTFKSWTQSELLAFWLNTYHCLLLHGLLLLDKPKSRGELARFYSRVSYLVGVKPVSLKEIEHYVLRIPVADKMAVNYAGRARGRQFLACLCCRKRGPPPVVRSGSLSRSPSGNLTPKDNAKGASPGSGSPRGGKASPDSKGGKSIGKPNRGDEESPPSSDSSDEGRGRNGKKVSKAQRKCLPKPNVHPVATGFDVAGKMAQRFQPLFHLNRRGPSACFFLGETPEPMGIPQKDMRAAFCLNRGNASCLASIPLFSDAHVFDQMEEYCKTFCAEFVKVLDKDNRPTRAILPHCCRGLKRELINDHQALLRFVWQFLPNSKERGQPTRSTQLRFTKFRREPRSRQELKRFAYSRPELVVSTKLGGKGPEFQVLAGAARALAEMSDKPPVAGELAPSKSEIADVRLDVADTDNCQKPRPTPQKRTMIMSL